jgi:hypothetical protein
MPLKSVEMKSLKNIIPIVNLSDNDNWARNMLDQIARIFCKEKYYAVEDIDLGNKYRNEFDSGYCSK